MSRFQINGNGAYPEINDASIRLDVYVSVEVDNVSFRGKKEEVLVERELGECSLSTTRRHMEYMVQLSKNNNSKAGVPKNQEEHNR